VGGYQGALPQLGQALLHAHQHSGGLICCGAVGRVTFRRVQHRGDGTAASTGGASLQGQLHPSVILGRWCRLSLTWHGICWGSCTGGRPSNGAAAIVLKGLCSLCAALVQLPPCWAQLCWQSRTRGVGQWRCDATWHKGLAGVGMRGVLGGGSRRALNGVSKICFVGQGHRPLLRW
jgi:hypothetical protein